MRFRPPLFREALVHKHISANDGDGVAGGGVDGGAIDDGAVVANKSADPVISMRRRCILMNTNYKFGYIII